MFILIFVDLKQINVTIHMGLFKVLFLHLKFLKIMTNKTYMINHIHIKELWLEKHIILIKDVKEWVDEKVLKIPMKKKRFSIIDQNTKIKKMGTPKNKMIEKT